MVCMRVAFHENSGNHENDGNGEDNSVSHKQGVECWIGTNFREQETMPLANHAFARVTPAIFVIFVVSQGLGGKALPCPSFPCFFEIPCFSPCEEFLVFLSVFPFFSKDFRASTGI